MTIKIKNQYEFRTFDNEYYEKKYSKINDALNYNENEDIETIRKESKSDKVIVWDTFLTNEEISALSSAINIIGETIDNIWESEWNDEEQKEQYEQTMKHLCRLSNRLIDKQGRLLI